MKHRNRMHPSVPGGVHRAHPGAASADLLLSPWFESHSVFVLCI
jgi:hypothetical protein